MGSEPGLSNQVVEALLNNETYFFRDRTPFDLLSAMLCRCSPSARDAAARSASGRPAARPARKPIRSPCCSPKTRRMGRLDDRHPRHRCVERVRSTAPAAASTPSSKSSAASASTRRSAGSKRATTAGARSSPCAGRSASRSTTSSSSRRTRARSTSSCAATSCSISAPRSAAWRSSGWLRRMAPDGWLMLGAGETVIGQTSKLASDSNARGLYRLVGDGRQAENRTGRPPRSRRGLDRRPGSCAMCAMDFDRAAFAQFRRAEAAGVDDRPALYRHARLPRARSTG